jgi:hypothetical protein
MTSAYDISVCIEASLQGVVSSTFNAGGENAREHLGVVEHLRCCVRDLGLSSRELSSLRRFGETHYFVLAIG